MYSCFNCKQTKKNKLLFSACKRSHVKCINLVSKCAMRFLSLAALCPLPKNTDSRSRKSSALFHTKVVLVADACEQATV